MKKCSKCGEGFPATSEYFSECKKNKNGLHEQCRKCKAKRDKEYRIANKAHYAEIKKQWKEANREHVNEVDKRYRENNKEHKSATDRKWREKNKERRNKTIKQWELDNKERRAETTKQWQKNNRDRVIIATRRYKYRSCGLVSTLTFEQWENAKRYFDNVCAYCGAKVKLTKDHFIPVVNDGGYTEDNILPACARCNRSKSTTSFATWYPKQGFYNKTSEQKILKYLSDKNEIQQPALAL